MVQVPKVKVFGEIDFLKGGEKSSKENRTSRLHSINLALVRRHAPSFLCCFLITALGDAHHQSFITMVQIMTSDKGDDRSLGDQDLPEHTTSQGKKETVLG